MVYQTLVYKGEKFDEQFGWEYGNILLFQSTLYANSASALDEFRTFQLPDGPWFAYMHVSENDEIIDEEMFDSYWIEGLS